MELDVQSDAANRDGVRERRSSQSDALRSSSASSPARPPLCLEPEYPAILHIDGSSTQLQQCGCLSGGERGCRLSKELAAGTNQNKHAEADLAHYTIIVALPSLSDAVDLEIVVVVLVVGHAINKGTTIRSDPHACAS